MKGRMLAATVLMLSVLVGCATPVARQVETLHTAGECCSDWRGAQPGRAPGDGWLRIPFEAGQAIGEFWGHRSYFHALDVSGLEGRELEVRTYHQAVSEPQYLDPVVVVLDAEGKVLEVWTPQLRRRYGEGFVAPHNESHLWGRLRVPQGAAAAVVLANDAGGVGRRAHAQGEAVSTADWNSPVAVSGPGRPRLERAPTGVVRVRALTD